MPIFPFSENLCFVGESCEQPVPKDHSGFAKSVTWILWGPIVHLSLLNKQLVLKVLDTWPEMTLRRYIINGTITSGRLRPSSNIEEVLSS